DELALLGSALNQLGVVEGDSQSARHGGHRKQARHLLNRDVAADEPQQRQRNAEAVVESSGRDFDELVGKSRARIRRLFCLIAPVALECLLELRRLGANYQDLVRSNAFGDGAQQEVAQLLSLSAVSEPAEQANRVVIETSRGPLITKDAPLQQALQTRRAVDRRKKG